MAEMQLGEAVHAVAVVAGIERVGDQHRVVDGGDVDAIALQQDEIVFEVLADLDHAGVGEQGLQRRQRLVERDLTFQHAAAEEIRAAAMLEGDVAGLARRDRHGDADEVGLHRVDRAGFRVDRDMAGLIGRCDPALERGEVAHAVIARAVDLGRQRLALAGGREVGWLQPAIASGRRDRLGDGGACSLRQSGLRLAGIGADMERLEFGCARATRRQIGIGVDRGDIGFIGFADALGDGGELHRLEEGDEPDRVGMAERQILDRRLDGDIVDQADQLVGDADLLDDLGIGQRLPALGLLDLGGPRQQRVEIAIFADELGRRLDADAGRAGHVVGRVARECLDVGDLVRRDAEILDDLGLTDFALGAEARALLGVAGGGVVHRHARPDELHQILVGRDDQHVGAGLARLFRIGRDQIVGLIDVLLDRQQAEGTHRLAHQRELRDQIRRRVRAVALIGRVDRLAERVLGFVEDDGEMRRPHPEHALAHELEELGGEEPDRAGGQTVRADIVFPVLIDRLEIGPEDEVGAVDQKEVVAGLQGGGCGGTGGGFGCLAHGADHSGPARAVSIGANRRSARCCQERGRPVGRPRLPL